MDDHVVLVDVRNATAGLSMADLWSLAQQASVRGSATVRKTAVLCAAGRFDRARFLALSVQRLDLDVRVFHEYHQAMAWLAADDT